VSVVAARRGTCVIERALGRFAIATCVLCAEDSTDTGVSPRRVTATVRWALTHRCEARS